MTQKFGLGRAQRLILPAEFKRVREEGEAARGTLLTLGVLASSPGPVRAGFVTSKKVGNAVGRNRVRRRLRAIFRRHQHEITPATWVITIARPPAARATSAELEQEWLRLAKRASILAP